MLTRRSFTALVVVLASALLSADPAAAQYTSITDLGDLGGGASIATSINARGQVAGVSLQEGATVQGAFIWEDGVVTDLGTLGGTFSQCLLGANNRGQFVGASTIAGDAAYHAFVTIDGVMTDLNPQIPPGSGWLLEYAYGLNERGQIVGAGHREGIAQTRAYLLSR